MWAEQAPDDNRGAGRKNISADPTISELRRANLRNCSCMRTSRMHSTYHMRTGAVTDSDAALAVAYRLLPHSVQCNTQYR
jgi:hypothetical protein